MTMLLFLFYPRKLQLKFGQNWVSSRWNVAFVDVVAVIVVQDDVIVGLKSDGNNWDIAGGGGGGDCGVVKFMSNPSLVMLS